MFVMGEAKRKRTHDWRAANQAGLEEMSRELIEAKLSSLEIFTMPQFMLAYPEQALQWLFSLNSADPPALCLTCDNEVGPPDHHITPFVSVLRAERLDQKLAKAISISGVCEECCDRLKTIEALKTAVFAVIKEKWMPDAQPLAGVGSA
jgi:hypothetical protein